MGKRAEALAFSWFDNDPVIAKPSVVRELTVLMEQYGRECIEAAAKCIDQTTMVYSMGDDGPYPESHLAEAIRKMDLP